MAIATLLVGILSGLTSFFVALVLGYGVVMALVVYAFGGLVGAVAIIVIAAIRSLAAPETKHVEIEAAAA